MKGFIKAGDYKAPEDFSHRLNTNHTVNRQTALTAGRKTNQATATHQNEASTEKAHQYDAGVAWYYRYRPIKVAVTT